MTADKTTWAYIESETIWISAYKLILGWVEFLKIFRFWGGGIQTSALQPNNDTDIFHLEPLSFITSGKLRNRYKFPAKQPILHTRPT